MHVRLHAEAASRVFVEDGSDLLGSSGGICGGDGERPLLLPGVLGLGGPVSAWLPLWFCRPAALGCLAGMPDAGCSPAVRVLWATKKVQFICRRLPRC